MAGQKERWSYICVQMDAKYSLWQVNVYKDNILGKNELSYTYINPHNVHIGE